MFEGLTDEYIEQTKPHFEAWRKYVKNLNVDDTKIDSNYKKIYKEIQHFISLDKFFVEADEEDSIEEYLQTMDINDIRYSPYILLSMMREYKNFVLDNIEQLNK